MYTLKNIEALQRYLDELASAFPDWFKLITEDYDRKVMITISLTDPSVMIELLAFPPKLPVVVKLGGPNFIESVLIDGHEVEADKKMLVHSIVSDLIMAFDVILPRDKEIIGYHPTQH